MEWIQRDSRGASGDNLWKIESKYQGTLQVRGVLRS
jgi:predicted secreted protein